MFTWKHRSALLLTSFNSEIHCRVVIALAVFGVFFPSSFSNTWTYIQHIYFNCVKSKKRIVVPFLFSSVYCRNVLEQKWRTTKKIELNWTELEERIEDAEHIERKIDWKKSKFHFKNNKKYNNNNKVQLILYILHLFSVSSLKTSLCVRMDISRKKIYSHFCKCSHFTWQHIILSFHYEILMDIS